MIINKERSQTLKKMLDLNLSCSTSTVPVFKSDLYDLAETLGTLWTIVEIVKIECNKPTPSWTPIVEALSILHLSSPLEK
jgi:hypothetical protein